MQKYGVFSFFSSFFYFTCLCFPLQKSCPVNCCRIHDMTQICAICYVTWILRQPFKVDECYTKMVAKICAMKKEWINHMQPTSCSNKKRMIYNISLQAVHVPLTRLDLSSFNFHSHCKMNEHNGVVLKELGGDMGVSNSYRILQLHQNSRIAAL